MSTITREKSSTRLAVRRGRVRRTVYFTSRVRRGLAHVFSVFESFDTSPFFRAKARSLIDVRSAQRWFEDIIAATKAEDESQAATRRALIDKRRRSSTCVDNVPIARIPGAGLDTVA